MNFLNNQIQKPLSLFNIRNNMNLMSSLLVIASGMWERVLPIETEIIRKHSSFTTVKNFSFKNRIITFQGPSSPLIPFGVKFSNNILFSSQTPQDSTFFISKSSIRNNNFFFDFEKSLKQDLKLHINYKFQLEHLDIIRDSFENYSALWQSKGHKYDFSNSFNYWINNSLKFNSKLSKDLSFYEPFNALLSSKDKIKSFYTYLLGWGSGSTPAGDDFLVGFLAGIHLLESSYSKEIKILTQLLQDILSNEITAKISQEFLLYALKGEFSETILKFIYEIHKYQNLSRNTVKNILIGSSSGLDFISGFIWVIEQLII